MIPYAQFRTGLTYRDVYTMLWSPDEDKSTWRHKSRGVVLGKWHQIKREMYDAACAAEARAALPCDADCFCEKCCAPRPDPIRRKCPARRPRVSASVRRSPTRTRKVPPMNRKPVLSPHRWVEEANGPGRVSWFTWDGAALTAVPASAAQDFLLQHANCSDARRTYQDEKAAQEEAARVSRCIDAEVRS